MTEDQWRLMSIRIRDIRQQRKISLKEMARLIDTHLCSISNIEHNRAHPSLECLVRIVTVLDVSMDYIVRGIRPAHNSSGLIFHSDDELEECLFLTE